MFKIPHLLNVFVGKASNNSHPRICMFSAIVEFFFMLKCVVYSNSRSVSVTVANPGFKLSGSKGVPCNKNVFFFAETSADFKDI